MTCTRCDGLGWRAPDGIEGCARCNATGKVERVETKLVGLSDLNVRAIEETIPEFVVRTTATTAVLVGSADYLLRVLQGLMAAMPDRRHHPYASLHAVARKLKRQVAA